jgi:monofunctional biosynthetic peptidoglycan transglycosylase
MPWRPAAPGAERRKKGAPARKARPRRSWLARLRRLLLRSLLVALLLPGLLILVYRVLPVPLTPLMVIRLAEGEGLAKDWVPLTEIAAPLPAAAVAAEDNLFCEHAGFDLGALRGEVEDYFAGRDVRGASTITMQTAKNLLLWPDRSILRKALEAWLTPQIEVLWPKDRIIEVYLNIVEFGPGIYGAEAAARHHFGKPASDLSAEEAALLAAVLPNPREWSASEPGEYVRSRVPTILTRIRQLGPRLDCVRPG